MNKNMKIAMLVGACGLAAVLPAQHAQAQPFVVNAHGATLLRLLLESPALTNDFIDVDGDGLSTQNGNPDQLALALPGSGPIDNTVPGVGYFVVQYRSIGSVNGLQELVDWGGRRREAAFNTAPFGASNSIIGNFAIGDGAMSTMSTLAANPARSNRTAYITNGVSTGLWYNFGNPGGAPFRHSIDGTFSASPVRIGNVPSVGGIQNHIAPIDVPSFWGATVPGTPKWNDRPGQPGYGTSPNNSRNAQGGLTGANFSNRLVDLPSYMSFYDGNPANANADTIFDTQFTFAPIAPVANFGTGYSQFTYTQLQHLFVTGRLPTGENLVIVTRDVGSGTHNGMMNSIGVDPSWGVGENIGVLNQTVGAAQLGAQFIPGNKGSNNAVRDTIRNVRLGVGYLGGDIWAAASGWTFADITAVRDDRNGRTAGTFARPTIANILDNGLVGDTNVGVGTPKTTDGWRIGGLAVFSTFGDPRQTTAADGGYGFIPGEANPGTPAMKNLRAAEFLNNLSRSVDAFNTLPGSDQTVFSPGEFVAANFFPVPALDFVPTNADGGIYELNARRTTALQEFARTNPLNVYFTNASRFETYGSAGINGVTPQRLANPATPYSDGATGATITWTTQGGSSLGQNVANPARNRIAADFNGDGFRNVDDAGNMIAAWRQRNGGPVWVAPNGTGPIAGALGTDAVIEILGDFTGDGNFSRIDVRYWADGLAIAVTGPNAGKLDRKAGFTAVDTAFNGNFFGTTLATPKAYAFGDARGDVANSAGNTTKGHIPIGADGNGDAVTTNDNRIDAFDIDYVCAQIRLATDGEVNWENLDEAFNADLSADINGDLKINGADITELVTVILGTQIGDVNLDGAKDATDRAIIVANQNAAGGWAAGDLNCDGLVNAADLAIFDGSVGPVCDSLDYNQDGDFPTPLDLEDFINANAGNICGTCSTDLDFNNDGDFPTPLDIEAFISVNAGGPCL